MCRNLSVVVWACPLSHVEQVPGFGRRPITGRSLPWLSPTMPKVIAIPRQADLSLAFGVRLYVYDAL